MLNTLVMLGYVSRIPESKRFRLTLKVVDLGLHAIGRADLREIARPILRSLVGEVNEAASLGVLDGADILYVERVRAGLTRIGVDIRIGTTIPAFWSTIGEAILAYLPQAELARVLATQAAPARFPHKPMNRDEIEGTLAAACARTATRCAIAVRQRLARARGAGARHRRLSAGGGQRCGAADADVDRGIPRAGARGGAARGRDIAPRRAGQRHVFHATAYDWTTENKTGGDDGQSKNVQDGRLAASTCGQRAMARAEPVRIGVDAGRFGLVCRGRGDGAGI